ncbi:MAG: hypothetical protein IJK81_05160 [Selenomonadaceae bacterium]|nr:hypothetical protein [Selenomonadaceae bacterium]
MTEEKNIDASAEQNKSADELLSDDELENVAGGTTGKYKPEPNNTLSYGVSGK